MTAILSRTPVYKAFANDGTPLAYGLLYTYAAGTTTPQATYIDSTQTTQNTNPIILNARGEAAIWLNPTLSYKYLLTDASGNQISGYPVDNIQGPLNPTGSIIPSSNNAFDLGSPSFEWRNVYAGTQVYVGTVPVYNAAAGIVGYYAQTAAEIAASVTPTNYAIPSHVGAGGRVYPERYGATGNCTFSGTGTDDTAAINAANAVANAMASKGTVWFQPLIYLTTANIAIPPGVCWDSAGPAWTNSADTSWFRGTLIWKAHSADAISISGESTHVHRVAIKSNKGSYATGNGFAVGAAFDVFLEDCNVFTVGGDSFVLGDNTTSSFTNSLTRCYSNNPGGRNFVIASQFADIDNIQSDGGTVGVDWLSNAFGFRAQGIHCEGWSTNYMRFNGSSAAAGNGTIYGWNYGLQADAVNPYTFIQFAAGGLSSNIQISVVLAQGAQVTGSIGVQFCGVSDGIHNANIDIVMQTFNVDLPVDAFGGSYVRIHNSFFQNQTNVFKQRCSDLTVQDCTSVGTTGATTGNFVSGAGNRYRNLKFDKPLWTGGTLIDGTNLARNITNFVTYNHGTTGSIASGTTVAHGLAFAPDSVFFGARYINAGSDLYASSTGATTFTPTWSGGANTQFSWEAFLPCYEH